MHWGDGPGLSSRVLGESGGSDTETLSLPELPSHTHTLNGSIAPAAQHTNTAGPTATFGESNPGAAYATTRASPVTFSPKTIGLTGSSQPHSNAQPRLALNFCIALAGVFPARG